MLNESSRSFADTPSLPNADAGKTLLLVDDDLSSCMRISRALERKGFNVIVANSVREGIETARRVQPRYAVVELRLADGNGLGVVTELRQWRADARIIMLTAYGNIATAVAAIKAGAVDYLPKPVDADMIEAALLAEGQALPPPPADPMSADRVKWEHIQRVYHQYGCNVSETARRLHMHRRTLQRILSKHAPRDNRSAAVEMRTGASSSGAMISSAA